MSASIPSPAPATPPHIVQLRRLVNTAVSGGDAVPLNQLLLSLYSNGYKAALQARVVQLECPTHTSLCDAHMEAHDVAMRVVEQMDDALAVDDFAALTSLHAEFEVADARVCELNQKTPLPQV